ncbi:hypothetical protein [Tumebacillus flagellatus]|uniref:DUF4367 domain-containing protein n=1 Tax=Tumebacillus flagellatus TaxID=1157490 RepID=A0A074LKN3_9BACL|nr:hypothetical protein [Tumebacillus flagellatus]KEO81654.1 hypothetical protein EL26_19470 [Tumebacillus flagellatus]
MQMPKEWHEAEVPEGGKLLRKESYEYQTDKGDFDIEVFENMKGEFYAIAVPRDDERLVIYGSNVTTSRALALSVVMEKIERE